MFKLETFRTSLWRLRKMQKVNEQPEELQLENKTCKKKKTQAFLEFGKQLLFIFMKFWQALWWPQIKKEGKLDLNCCMEDWDNSCRVAFGVMIHLKKKRSRECITFMGLVNLPGKVYVRELEMRLHLISPTLVEEAVWLLFWLWNNGSTLYTCGVAKRVMRVLLSTPHTFWVNVPSGMWGLLLVYMVLGLLSIVIQS